MTLAIPSPTLALQSAVPQPAQAPTRPASDSQMGNAWGPATIINVSSNSKSQFEAIKSKLSATWQEVLGRVLTDPQSLQKVTDKFESALQSYRKRTEGALKTSSLSETNQETRKAILKRIETLKQQIVSATASEKNAAQNTHVKGLINELKNLAAQLQATGEGTNISSVGAFNGAGAATNALNGLDTAPASIEGDVSSQADQEAQMPLSDDQKCAIANVINSLQETTKSENANTTTLGQAESVDQDFVRKAVNDVENFIEKIEKLFGIDDKEKGQSNESQRTSIATL